MDIKIDYLCGKWMHNAGKVAQWVYDAHYKSKKTHTFDQVLASVKICYAGYLPIRLVATIGEECIGTISIVKEDIAGKSYTPWITLLYVDGEDNVLEVSKMLITRSKEVLKTLGHKEIYVKDAKGKLYKTLGWQYVEKCKDGKQKVKIFKTQI